MFKVIYNNSKRRRWFFFVSIIFIPVAFLFGVFTHLFEIDYHSNFAYPLDMDIKPCVKNLQAKLPTDCPVINSYNYSYLFSAESKCNNENNNKLRLVFIIKSKMDNFNQRLAIRKSWGFEKRFSDVPMRTVFLLGVEENVSDLQRKIEEESKTYGDIVQANFIDTYFNNTIKTMIGFRWAVEFCQNSKFYFFSDDDMYISAKNILRFVRNPVNYPDYLEKPVISLHRNKREESPLLKSSSQLDVSESSKVFSSRKLNQVLDFELPDDVKLFAGYVFFTAPHRHYLSKWYISLGEYPFSMWPPYVTAGSYVLSSKALLDLYFASFFTKHFRFDDIYLGLLAKKVDIEPFHSSDFHFYKKSYNFFNYKYLISSHGYSDPKELSKVWNEQKSAGNA